MEHGSDGYNQSSLAYNFELFSGKKAVKYIRPLVGFLGTEESAYYGYFGLSVDLYFSRCKCFVFHCKLYTFIDTITRINLRNQWCINKKVRLIRFKFGLTVKQMFFLLFIIFWN